MRVKLLLLFFVLLFACTIAQAQDESAEIDTSLVENLTVPPAPPSNLQVIDKPNDHGHATILTWELSPDDGAGSNSVVQYEIYRWRPSFLSDVDDIRDSLDVVQKIISRTTGGIAPDSRVDSILTLYRDKTKKELFALRANYVNQLKAATDKLPVAYETYPENGSWQFIDKALLGISRFEDIGSKEFQSHSYLTDNANLHYKVEASTLDGTRSEAIVFGPVQSSGQWYNTFRTPVLFAVIIFTFLTIFFVSKARKGADLYVRPLGGIEAIDDAIGRATEMGRPILYVLGLGTAADIATIASFTILGRVAKRVAEYQKELLVPTYDPIVMTVAQVVVKSAYLDAGRPDAYKEDTVHFVTQSQFAYVAAVNGIMLRELPATNVYMGKFFAESLILAETGALAGSIQISGTDEIAQIPFFIVACDYTLIGEELYAASAYLGKEPVLLGSLKAQDYAKAAIIVLSIVGILLAQFEFGVNFTDLFKVLN